MDVAQTDPIRSVTATLLGGVVGCLIGLPLVAHAGMWFLPVLTAVAGAVIGHHKRASTFFFYFMLLCAVILLWTLAGNFVEPLPAPSEPSSEAPSE